MSAARKKKGNGKNITLVLWLVKRGVRGWVFWCTLATVAFRRQGKKDCKGRGTATSEPTEIT